MTDIYKDTPTEVLTLEVGYWKERLLLAIKSGEEVDPQAFANLGRVAFELMIRGSTDDTTSPD